jgi:hypothetical protein
MAQNTDHSNPTHAEAPCSVNAHLDLDGLRCQVTGCGATGADAAANFRATRDAMLTPGAPMPTPLTARDVALSLILCAVDKERLPLAPRIAKALQLVEAGAVTWTSDDHLHAEVASQTEPGVAYALTYTPGGGWGCNCYDWQHADSVAGKRVCKHAIAAHIARVLSA